MRILSIALKNLNSLRGEHRIDLENGPLGSTRLFAITGRTGAGKTTILDAVTLALYGRAARYDKGSPSNMMTRYEVEARAEVIFTHDTGRYAASWDIHRARRKPTGKIMPAKRRIIRETDGTIIAEKNREADAWIEEETGLDYERFLRSILLAQNDFAAFLQADDNERAQLLEKLTGISTYRELSQLCYDYAREKKQACAVARNVMGHVHVWPDEKRQQKERELDETRKQTRRDGARLQALAAAVDWQQQWSRLNDREAAFRSREERWVHAWNDFSEDKQNLDRHDLVSKHAPELRQLNETRKEKERLGKEIVTLKKNISALKPRVADALKNHTEASDLLKQREIARVELEELTEKVRPLDQRLSVLNDRRFPLDNELQTATKTINEIQSDEALNKKKKDKIQEQLTELRLNLERHNRDKQLVDALPTVRDICGRFLSANERLQEKRSSVRNTRTRMAKLQSESEALQAKVAAIETKISAVHRKRDSLTEQKQGVSGNRPLLDWRKDLEKDSALLADQRQRHTIGQRIADATDEIHQVKKRIQSDSETVAAKRLELERCASDIERQEKLVRLESAVAEQQETIKRLRGALETGGPCPVCGATEHPHAHESINQNQLPSSETSTESELNALQTKASNLRSSIVRLEERINGRKEQQANLAESVKNQAKALPRKFPAGLSDQLTLLSTWKDQISALETACKTSRKSIAAIETLDKELEECTARNAAMEKERSLLREKQIASETALHEWRVQYREAVSAAWTLRADGRQTRRLLTKSVQAFFPTTPLPQPGSMLEDLEERASQFANWLSKEKDLNAEQATISVALKELGKRKTEATLRLDQTSGERKDLLGKIRRVQVKRTELFGEKLPAQELKAATAQITKARETVNLTEKTHTKLAGKLIANETLLNNLETRYKTINKTLKDWEQQMTQIATELGFSNLKTLGAALLDPKTVLYLRDRLATLEKERLAFRAGTDEVSREKESLRNAAVLLRVDEISEGKDSNTLTKRINELKERRDKQLGREGELKIELRDDDNRRKQQSTEQENLRKLELDHARWDRLRELIGSADGASFSRFAQGLTLEQLCGEANRHLASLTDRYALQRSDPESLELEVIDRYQAEAVRSLSSLSGGETFLVSLALALALSSLAGNSDALQSLFIDEGFGTLDSESLETALSALERLHGEDRQIGIISHVELLKERIPVRLHVCASRDGYSSVRVEQR